MANEDTNPEKTSPEVETSTTDASTPKPATGPETGPVPTEVVHDPEPVKAEPVKPEAEKPAPKPEAPPLLTQPAEPHAVPRDRPIVLPLIIGGIVAAVLGFGLARLVPGGWPVQDTTELRTEISRQAQEITSLRDQLGALSLPNLAPLEERVARLENTPADLSGIQGQIDELRGQMTEGTLSPDLQAIVQETEQKLADAQAQATQLQEQSAAAARAATTSAALTRIAAAVDSGTPYGSALGNLREAGVEVPEPLVANEGGLPTITALQASFPEAARAGLEASLKADMGATWADRVGSFLRAQTGARSLSPREGNDPDAILSRAEAALARGDLPATLSEVGSLPLEGQAAMSAWRAEAEKRTTAVQALDALTASVEGN